MPRIPIDQAKTGMILSRPVVNDSGITILNQGAVLTEEHIEKLKDMGILQVSVVGERRDLTSLDEALDALERRFRISEKEPYMDLIKRAVERHLRSIHGQT